MKSSLRYIAGIILLVSNLINAQSNPNPLTGKKLYFLDSQAAIIQFNQLYTTQEIFENWQLRHTAKFQFLHVGNEEVLYLQNAMKPWLIKNNISPGIFFPSSLTGNNNPELFPSSSAGNWIYASAAERNPLVKPGISGYAAQTSDLQSHIKINIPAEFQKVTDRLRIYCDRQENSYDIQIKTSNSGIKNVEIHGFKSDQHQIYIEIPLLPGCKFVEISFKKNKALQTQFILHGISLENSTFPTYHFIGVRGNNFTVMSDFSQWQLNAKKLNPQMLIIDLFQGDIFRFNDGLVTEQKAESYTASLRRFFNKSAITWVLPQEMFRGNNALSGTKILEQSVDFKFRTNKIKLEPFADFLFDWYRAAGGENSAYYWSDSGLLKPYYPALTDLGMGVKSALWSKALSQFLTTIPENTRILSPIDTTKSLKKPIKDTVVTRSISKESWKYHVVKRGETAYRISAKYGISPNQLKSWNNLRSYYIYPGQRLKVGKTVTISFENITIPKNQSNLTADDFNPTSTSPANPTNSTSPTTETPKPITPQTPTTDNSVNNPPKSTSKSEATANNTQASPKPPTPNSKPIEPVEVENPLLKVRYHRVASGETLYSIAKKYEVTVDSIKLLNRLNNNNIAVGRVLKIR